MKKKLTLAISTETGRIDRIIASSFPEHSRSQVQNWLKAEYVTVNDQVVKANYKVNVGDVVQVNLPEPKPLALTPENIPLKIVYEDDDVIVIDKPQGMVVHPSPGHDHGTLVNALLAHTTLAPINDTFRPGIVHRIDKDTSGLLMVAKSQLAMTSLSAQLKAKTNKREYLALVHGNFKEDSGRIEAPIGRSLKDRKKQAVIANGRFAVTHFEVAERFTDYTLLRCRLETGRTHQIRVHLKYIGHPVVGDPLYGPKKTLKGNGQFLHAAVLGFEHPRSGKWLEFSAPLPPIFERTLENLRKS